jgi:hypothetical protein
LFDVCGSQNGKRPEVITEVCVDEHGACHATNSAVHAFSNAVLWGRVGDRFFVGDALCMAVGLHLAVDEFGGVVDMEKFDSLSCEGFGRGFELCEEGQCFASIFH